MFAFKIARIGPVSFLAWLHLTEFGLTNDAKFEPSYQVSGSDKINKNAHLARGQSTIEAEWGNYEK